MKNKISLIIPSISDEFFVNDFLTNIYLWIYIPSEIILINTSGKKIKIDKYINRKFKSKKVTIKIINKKNLYPGAARNLGLRYSKFKYILFLDMNTVPYSKNWLNRNFNYLIKNKLDGLYGQTFYLANSYQEKIIRASTYGKAYLRTIPGSIFSKETLLKVGKFNSMTRAGEDTEWINRSKRYNLKIIDSIEPIFYKGLYNATYLGIIKKWFRNYSYSANLPHLAAQKNLYIFLLFLFVFFSVFNWNSSSLNWDSGIGIFIPHITKIFLLFSSFVYLFIRGAYIPLIKKVNLRFLLPLNIFGVTVFSFILDTTKLIAFCLSLFLKTFRLSIYKKI